MKPAKTRAVAPVMRFWVFESLGRTELLRAAGLLRPDGDVGDPEMAALALLIEVWLFATSCRSVLKVVKYNAEPKPVRSAEGSVPRQRLATG